MKNNVLTDLQKLIFIREAGMNALKKELGAVGTACFLRLFSTGGYGDYTAERDKIFEGITMDEIIKGIQEIEKKREQGESTSELNKINETEDKYRLNIQKEILKKTRVA